MIKAKITYWDCVSKLKTESDNLIPENNMGSF